MFASRGFRLSAVLATLVMAFSLVAVDTAEARSGGSFGSRGTRTYQSVPATPTSPGVTAPVQRSMTSTTARQAGTTATAPRSGWFGGFGGWMLGGLLFSGLFGLMFGAGFGGFGGFISLIFQVILISLVVSWLFRRRRPAMAGAGYGSPYEARQDWQPSGGRPSGSAGPRTQASARAGARDELGLGDRDVRAFEGRLSELQNAYAREDFDGLRRITTPEMMSYLTEELATNARDGVRNEVYDVRLLSGDIAEAWREGSDEYATVPLRYESRDITREVATGKIVKGEDGVVARTEIWTFVRHSGGPWLVSAIQQA
ncbi:MAG: TIM44-like domain-containing protein [Devosia nanyangense]|uniref:TIM44-like domain-containing protein n=1 Tax=Devosia nanyangense TaxID=1228055 RepID=A0A933NZI3_9HYPH|nr:TIM44-like domain-containing protein [Devosia nanyangense]